MLKTILKTSGVMACLLVFGVAHATGLGEIVVSSSLGQPLRAEIELVSVDKADLSSISAKMATADAFKRAGIDYPYALPRPKFEIVGRDTGRLRILITTAQPVNEPFVTMMVEVVWSSGKLLREYTFLLDPVGYDIPAPPVSVISPVAPAVPAVSETAQPPQMVEPAAPVAAAESASIQPVTESGAPTPEATAAAPAQASAETVVPAPATSVTQEASDAEAPVSREQRSVPIAVVRGDTLSKIALRTKPADVSLERMLLALYRANTGAFRGKNMNRLQAGKVIRVPDAGEIEAVGQKEAVQEYRAQVRDWNAYRQQLAAARAATGEQQEARKSASGKVTASVAETAPTAKEPKEVLKLSKGQAPGEQPAGTGSSSKEEDAVAREKSLRDAQERTALLEKNAKDLQRLAELKKAQSAASGPGAAGSTAAPKPAAKPAVPAPIPAPQAATPSFLDELLGDPLLLGGGAIGVLLLLGGGFWLSRRRRIRPAKVALAEEAGGETGRIAAPVAPSPDTGDFTRAAETSQPADRQANEDDPIAEADLFLSFGRDTQAEEVLKDALSTRPGNIPIILKLLNIYANRKDAGSFLTCATQIKESGDEAAWSQAAAMGRMLEPGNPLYGGSGEPISEPEAEAAPVVDFDLGFGGVSDAAAGAGSSGLLDSMTVETPTHETTTKLSAEDMLAAHESPMDFDVTGTRPPVGAGAAGSAHSPSTNLLDTMIAEMPSQETTAKLSADDLGAAQDASIDFDVTGTRPPVGIAMPKPVESSSLDDLIFDVTSTHPGIKSGATDTAVIGATLGGMDDSIFDVTSTHPGIPAAGGSAQPSPDEPISFELDIPDDFKRKEDSGADAPLDIGLGDISLNLDGLDTGTSGTGNRDERWQEVATKLDLAKAYQEMGDAAGTREILDEVLRDGDEQQRASAQAMLDQL